MIDHTEFNLYKDIQSRTYGELFLGIVGPVRTGKSTFVRRFMNQVVLPQLEDEQKSLTNDELPVSGRGTLITTVEPKFVPKDAAKIIIGNNIDVKVRLIDCVGYVVDGATGVFDQEKERMVKTPWFTEEIPFSKAAHIGTTKVIKEHSTIGIVVTCDGSFGELKREQFIEAEEKTITELKEIGKPFIIILNSTKPYSDDTKLLQNELSQKYGVSCIALNCDQLRQEDVNRIMEDVLCEFPVSAVNFYMPKWMEMMPQDNEISGALLESISKFMDKIYAIKDIERYKDLISNDFIEKYYIDEINMATGNISVSLNFSMEYYYQMLSAILGKAIHGEYEFISELKKLVEKKNEFDKISKALNEVKQKGYGAVLPVREEIIVNDPVIIKHGNKYGVNIRANAPSIHMISANIETEIAPLVGTQQQAQDLVDYIKSAGENSSEVQSVWDTLIFGKSMGELVDEGMKTKISKMTESCQEKLQETLQKIINESNGSVIFVII